MARPGNLFENYDFTRLWGEFKIPMWDVEALMMAQQRNLDAVSSASKCAVEGFQQAAQRQAELVRGVMEHGSAAAQEYARLTSPSDKLTHQAKFAKAAFESSVDSARELSDIMTKAATDAAEIVNKRIIEGFDEFEGIVAKTNGAMRAKPTPKTGAK